MFSLNELFKFGKIQIESTSFTVSEPVSKYTIEPLIYKYANDDEKKIIDFEYMKINFNEKLIDAFNKMQKIYVLDDQSIITIDELKKNIKFLLEVFTNL